MPEQLMGTIGSIVDVRLIAGSNALYVFDTSTAAGTTNVLGSVEISNTAFKPISIIGSPNYNLPVSLSSLLGSVEVSSIVGALPAGTNLLGSVKAEITNAQINVDVTVADYVSVVGSPNYRLPVIGSVEVSNISSLNTSNILGSVEVSSIRNPLPAGTNIIGSMATDIQKFGVSLPTGTNLIGSVVADVVGITTSDYISIVGSPNYNLPVSVDWSAVAGSVQGPHPGSIVGVGGFSDAGSLIHLHIDPIYVVPKSGDDALVVKNIIFAQMPNNNFTHVQATAGGNLKVGIEDFDVTLPSGSNIIGSIAADIQKFGVSLPAGTNLIGSVIADIVGLSTSDYISVVGSPNYNLPIIGSVQVSSVGGTVTVAATDLDIRNLASASDSVSVLGSVEISNTAFKPISIIGSPNYLLPVIGSVEVSKLVGALPIGTNSIGNIGSIGAGIVGSVYSVGSATLTGGDGSIWVTSSSTTVISPLANRKTFVVVGGSVASDNVSSKWWCSLTASAIVGKGIELTVNQPFGLEGYTGSVFGVTDAGSILVGYTQI